MNRDLYMIFLRSLFLNVAMAVHTTVCFCIMFILFWLPRKGRNALTRSWAYGMIWLAKHICGITYEVTGRENIPAEPGVILCKHQSAWETMAIQFLLPPQVTVAKRILAFIPFFGWGLALSSPILIDRSSGRAALQQIINGGRKRISQGFWITIFPEGTRIAVGKRVQYKIGGALLAKALDVHVLPVAHNAGTVWPKNSFLKHPGHIKFVIGKPIKPDDLTAEQLIRAAETWIEAEVANLPHAPQA